MNKRVLITVGAISVIILIMEFIAYLTQASAPIYDNEGVKDGKIPALQQWKRNYDENRSYYEYWGLPRSKDFIIEEEIVEKNATEALVPVEKKEGSNVLCIRESCYRLLGIKLRSEEFVAVLYNAKIKDKIVEVYEGDMLEANITIENVEPLGVRFADEVSGRQWRFEMFDVNSTKYLPKETDDN